MFVLLFCHSQCLCILLRSIRCIALRFARPLIGAIAELYAKVVESKEMKISKRKDVFNHSFTFAWMSPRHRAMHLKYFMEGPLNYIMYVLSSMSICLPMVALHKRKSSSTIAVGGVDGTISCYNFGERMTQFLKHRLPALPGAENSSVESISSPVNILVFSGSGNHIVAFSRRSCMISIWSTKSSVSLGQIALSSKRTRQRPNRFKLEGLRALTEELQCKRASSLSTCSFWDADGQAKLNLRIAQKGKVVILSVKGEDLVFEKKSPIQIV